MSKSKKHDNFMQLIPREDTKTVYTVSKSEPDEVEYWKTQYETLKKKSSKKIKMLEDELKVATEMINTLEASARVADRLITSLHGELLAASDFSEDDDYFNSEDDLDEDDYVYEDDDEYDEDDSPFDHGIGLSIGKDPRFYRIQEGKRDYTKPKKKKFGGIDLEVQPGRGFRIAPRWDED